MSEPPSTPRPLSADDALPPVEPPSAGFIVQLFVVPGVIVVIIVLVWLMINWLAHKGNDPAAYVAQLERNNAIRWQAANNLASALSEKDNEQSKALKENHQIAARLAELLEQEIKSGSLEEQPVMLRYYLCRTLGEFYVTDGLPALVHAATTQRDEKEAEVRLGALAAIAVLANHWAEQHGGERLTAPGLDEAVQKAAADNDPRFRVQAAFTLGVLGDEKSIAELTKLLEDGNADVAYNAAMALARHGKPEVIDTLRDMLTVDLKSPAVQLEKIEKMQDYKRWLIVHNGLSGVAALATHNSTADLSSLAEPVARLRSDPTPKNVQVEAREVQQLLEKRKPAE